MSEEKDKPKLSVIPISSVVKKEEKPPEGKFTPLDGLKHIVSEFEKGDLGTLKHFVIIFEAIEDDGYGHRGFLADQSVSLEKANMMIDKCKVNLIDSQFIQDDLGNLPED